MTRGWGSGTRPGCWPATVAGESPGPWVLVQISAPVASGPLWEHLVAWHRDRLVVVRAGDLRGSQVQISRGSSWERTAQDLASELTNNPAVGGLAGCAHEVVLFGAAGAVVVSRQDPASAGGGHPAFSLIFDPAGDGGRVGV